MGRCRRRELLHNTKPILSVVSLVSFVVDQRSTHMSVLDNPAWSALTTHQAHLATGGSLARRYPDDVAPIAAIGRREDAALEELVDLIPEGGWISLPATLEGITAMLPPQLAITLEKRLVQMVCETEVDLHSPRRSTPDRGRLARPRSTAAAGAIRTRGVDLCVLGEADIPEMLALTKLTRPGPFQSQTYTLGLYLGIRVDGRLAAMGGQRMHAPGYREISAICTHPDFQGRGYARTVVARLVTETFDRGLIPFLHVEETNERAQALYRDLGFVERTRLPLLVVKRERDGAGGTV